MAAPSDAGRNSTSISTAANPWATVNLPASIAAGDLLLAFGRTGGAQTFTLPAGWNWGIENNVADATDDATSLIWKVAAGNEGASFSWGLSGNAKGASITYRITGHNGWLNGIPTPFTYTTAANAADPPDSGTLPSDDYLLIVFAAIGGETQTFTAAPTNYVNLTTQNSGTGGLPATNCRVASASRGLTGITSENPGAFTHGGADGGGIAITLAIRQLVTRSNDLKQMRLRGQAVSRGSTW